MKALFAVSALLSAAGFFLPVSEKNASLRKQISLALGAVLLVFALRPLAALPALIGNLSQPLSENEISEGESDTLDAVGEEAYCLGIRRAIAERFVLSEEEISVSVYGFSFSAVSAERIDVLLSGKAARADLSGIRRYVGETFGDCEVEIALG